MNNNYKLSLYCLSVEYIGIDELRPVISYHSEDCANLVGARKRNGCTGNNDMQMHTCTDVLLQSVA